MKTTVSTILLAACLALLAELGCGADDIFSTPPKSDKTNQIKYRTSAEFLAATRSGEIPEFLGYGRRHAKTDVTEPIGMSVIAILRDEYRVEDKNAIANFIGGCLEEITKYEMGGRKDDEMVNHRFGRGFILPPESNPKFMEAFDKLANDYAKAVREVYVLKQERDGQRLKAEAEAEAEKKRQADADRQRVQEILASPAFKLREAAKQVEGGLRMIEAGKQTLEHDAAVERESGVVNLTARRRAGEMIVSGKLQVERAFANYRQLGGTAQTPEQVHAGSAPAKANREPR